MPTNERVDRFLGRLGAYNVHVERLAAETDIAEAVGRRLAVRPSSAVAVPEGIPTGWLAQASVLAEPDLSQEQLDAAPAVLTICALAIAETGSIVLDGGVGQGRRAATLLPDHHICIVFEDQIVGLLPEAIAALRPAADEGRPITFISGPSATADIEFDRVVGVHGPRTLDVILVARRTDTAKP